MLHSKDQNASHSNLQTVIVDIEEVVNGKSSHPPDDPGIIIIYRFKVDNIPFESRERWMNRDEIMALVNKDPESFDLFQKINSGHDTKLDEIKPHERVDFKKFGVEQFFTKPKVYCFHIGPKKYETNSKTLTVRQILVDFAKVDPANKTLAKKTDGGYHEYKNLDEVVSLADCPHFTLFDNTPTQVS